MEGHQKGLFSGGAFELRTTCKALVNSKISQIPSRFPLCSTQETGQCDLEPLRPHRATSKGQVWGCDVLRVQPRLRLQQSEDCSSTLLTLPIPQHTLEYIEPLGQDSKVLAAQPPVDAEGQGPMTSLQWCLTALPAGKEYKQGKVPQCSPGLLRKTGALQTPADNVPAQEA